MTTTTTTTTSTTSTTTTTCPPPVGNINEVKVDLMELIGEADSSITCYGDWYEAMDKIYSPKTGLKMPVVTVRVSPLTTVHMVYTRKIPESGAMATMAFTAHLFHNICVETGREKYYYAHEIADKIMKYLDSYDYHADNCTAIADLIEVAARESEPKRGAKRLSRIIIEGTLLLKRID